MNPRDGARMHAIIIAGCAAKAQEYGKGEAARLGALLENGYLDSLRTDAERKAYYQGCDSVADGLSKILPGKSWMRQ